MKNKILLFIFSLFLFLISDNAFALVNYVDEPVLNLDYENVDFSTYPDIGGYTYIDLVNYIIDVYNSNKTDDSADILIVSDTIGSTYYLRVFLIEPGTISNYIYQTRNSKFSPIQFDLSYTYPVAQSSRYFDFVDTMSSSDLSSKIDSFSTAINNVTTSNTTWFYGSYVTLIDYNISSTHKIPIYFSGDSSNLIYDTYNYIESNSYNYYIANLSYLGNLIKPGEQIPTYYDYLEDISNDSANEYNKFIDNYYGLFFSNIPSDKLYDYNVKFTVAQNLFYEDISYAYNLYGRVNHGTYYTYEHLTCTVGTSNEEPIYGGEGLLEKGYIYQTKNLSVSECSNDLTKYDYIYINAFTFSNSSIYYFNFNTNYGYVSINDFIDNPNKVLDYFDFSSSSNMFISSNSNSSSLYFGSKDINKFFGNTYSLETFQSEGYFNPVPFNNLFNYIERFNYIGKSRNIGVGFNLYSNYTDATLYVLVDTNILISFDSNVDSNDNFNYYDSSGNVVNNSFNVNTSYNPDTGTSVDNYFVVVEEFINSISDDIKSVSEVFQHLYDMAPEFLQTIIFVFYILIMSYILFKLIRK